MIIERIEENIVIVENDNGEHFEVSKDNFPENIKEGDFVLESDDCYIIDNDKTIELRKKITELQNSLLKWNFGGKQNAGRFICSDKR